MSIWDQVQHSLDLVTTQFVMPLLCKSLTAERLPAASPAESSGQQRNIPQQSGTVTDNSYSYEEKKYVLVTWDRLFSVLINYLRKTVILT